MGFIMIINKLFNMNEDNEIYLVIILVLAPLIFSIIDFTSCLVDHGVITWFNCYTFKTYICFIPILLICSIIAKVIWREKSLKDVLEIAFAPLFFWLIEIGFALFVSLFIGVFIDMIIGIEAMV
ncbi:hypothetical protein mru_1302 [Methanobrevibacter ruminantium M1]|uniref:Uncharacterized protein n=2 Tax=Methanobrevibacter ruminantium TaxID=83816 RepID=D3E3P1_METRM|nr:hypothetical protein mru_1302 [Methanobrevibacter ruminantium M1]